MGIEFWKDRTILIPLQIKIEMETGIDIQEAFSIPDSQGVCYITQIPRFVGLQMRWLPLSSPEIWCTTLSKPLEPSLGGYNWI